MTSGRRRTMVGDLGELHACDTSPPSLRSARSPSWRPPARRPVAGVQRRPRASSGTAGSPLDGTHWKLTSFDAGGTSTAVPAGIVTVDARFAAGNDRRLERLQRLLGPRHGRPARRSRSARSRRPRWRVPARGRDRDRPISPALAKAATFTATADALTMFDASGASILVYAAGPANPLEGDWNVTGYNNGKQAVTSPISGTTLTATFTADAVSGSSGLQHLQRHATRSTATRSRSGRSRRRAWPVTRRSWTRRRCSSPRWRHRRPWSRLARWSPFAMPTGRPRSRSPPGSAPG